MYSVEAKSIYEALENSIRMHISAENGENTVVKSITMRRDARGVVTMRTEVTLYERFEENSK